MYSFKIKKKKKKNSLYTNDRIDRNLKHIFRIYVNLIRYNGDSMTGKHCYLMIAM